VKPSQEKNGARYELSRLYRWALRFTDFCSFQIIRLGITLNLEAILGAAGPLTRALEGFTPRPAQQQMAARIDAALRAREVLLVEAGTGTGKTYAYLVPALLSGLRVLISTGTRTLQDQLFHRDLPLLAGALGRPARVALLKGRSNYLCRARLADIGRQDELLPVSADVLLGRIRDWSQATRSGDLAELPELSDTDPVRLRITSTRENCSGTRCSEIGRCHVFEARRDAMDADIVVVNHHLLLADMALKEEGFGDLLPSVDAVVLDEAHQLPDLASEFFGVSVSSRQLELLLTDLKREPGSAELASAPASNLERSLAAVHALLGRADRHLGFSELRAEVHAALRTLQRACRELGATLEASCPPPGLQTIATRARTLAAALRQVISPPEDVHADSDSDGEGVGEAGGEKAAAASVAGARTLSTHARGFVLRLLPYEIASRFQAQLVQGRNAWIFTSATLAVGDDFSHFASRLGLTGAAALRLDSPFDYSRQALLYLPQGLPPPSDPGFSDAVIQVALPLLESAGGGAFVLFTSHRALRHAAQRLTEALPAELPLLVQGSAPRELLLRRFRASGRAVLLGTASFWEGVDVQGPALRLVIIDKLPFASPEDPVVRARIEYLKTRGGNAFRDYQLPEAVLALKQGVGRLIRSEQDRGVVVICDPRMSERAYGRIFRASLPPMPTTQASAVVLQRLRELSCETAGT
jgi:ATP-dependent DNA helicase DinG